MLWIKHCRVKIDPNSFWKLHACKLPVSTCVFRALTWRGCVLRIRFFTERYPSSLIICCKQLFCNHAFFCATTVNLFKTFYKFNHHASSTCTPLLKCCKPWTVNLFLWFLLTFYKHTISHTILLTLHQPLSLFVLN